MKFNIHYGKSRINRKEEDLLKEKLTKLGNKYDWIVNADIFFKEEKGNPNKSKVCEIKLSVPGPLIYAHSKEKEFDLAIIETISDLEVLLQKRKDSMKWKRANVD